MAVGWLVVNAGLSAVSDNGLVRKSRSTNGMQELRTEENSLKLRKVGSWLDQRWELDILALGTKLAR